MSSTATDRLSSLRSRAPGRIRGQAQALVGRNGRTIFSLAFSLHFARCCPRLYLAVTHPVGAATMTDSDTRSLPLLLPAGCDAAWAPQLRPPAVFWRGGQRRSKGQLRAPAVFWRGGQHCRSEGTASEAGSEASSIDADARSGAAVASTRLAASAIGDVTIEALRQKHITANRRALFSPKSNAELCLNGRPSGSPILKRCSRSSVELGGCSPGEPRQQQPERRLRFRSCDSCDDDPDGGDGGGTLAIFQVGQGASSAAMAQCRIWHAVTSLPERECVAHLGPARLLASLRRVGALLDPCRPRTGGLLGARAAQDSAEACHLPIVAIGAFRAGFGYYLSVSAHNVSERLGSFLEHEHNRDLICWICLVVAGAANGHAAGAAGLVAVGLVRELAWTLQEAADSPACSLVRHCCLAALCSLAAAGAAYGQAALEVGLLDHVQQAVGGGLACDHQALGRRVLLDIESCMALAAANDMAAAEAEHFCIGGDSSSDEE
eukprot:TRINITY_DN3459_c0_g1_i2.p2 TRINITY_DN3459_c0_g1~~TRINITY_DN3459_c0_g1_i2.p2  ORF type:complete len:492 (-),score=79.21 TRINITY_DN3459_c0_g1_i2:134-1609(-)